MATPEANIVPSAMAGLHMDVPTIVTTVQQQQARHDANKPVEPIIMHVPRVDTALDRQTHVAREAALQLYPMDPDYNAPDLEKRRWAYIRFNQLVTQLRRLYRAQLQEQRRIESQAWYRRYNDKYHQVRLTRQQKLWNELVNAPCGRPVLEPEPMPVMVPPLDDFKPFFCHMKTQQPRPNRGEPHFEFQRGAFYSDGRIDMCKQVPGPDHIGAMMDAICKREDIHHFLMGNSIVGLEGAKCIAAHIRTRPPIETWYLAGNQIDAQGVQLICQSLVDDTMAKALWLKRNPLGPQGVKHIADMLVRNTSLEILDLHNVNMQDEGCVYLFDQLRHNTTLRLIYLNANGLTAKSCVAMADYFKYMAHHNRKGLTSLFVGMNPIKDEGVRELSKGFIQYVHLERLCVSSARFTWSGLHDLVENIKGQTCLKHLDIGMYKSTADMMEVPNNLWCEAQQVAPLFKTMLALTEIFDCRSCQLDEEQLEALADAAEQDHCVHYIYAEQYGLRNFRSRRALARIREACERNCKEHGYASLQDYCTNHLRRIKHTKRVDDIDSIYRNNM